MATNYRKRTPRRRHISFQQRRLAEALTWLREVADGPAYIVPTRTWTQDERDRFIVKNNLTHVLHPEHDLDFAQGILVRDLPTFLKTGYDYHKERSARTPPW